MSNGYLIKCDICRKTIKENATFIESVQGGKCNKCKKKIKNKQYDLL